MRISSVHLRSSTTNTPSIRLEVSHLAIILMACAVAIVFDVPPGRLSRPTSMPSRSTWISPNNPPYDPLLTYAYWYAHHTQQRNAFGLSRSYKGVPSSVPDQPDAPSYIPGYVHPEPQKEPRAIHDIVYPYPNLSSFLFDHHFWMSSTTKSRKDRDILRDLVGRDDFNTDDIKEMDFRKIEEELRGRSSRYGWEQERGWRKSDITIGVPLGIKRTASVRR